MTSKPLKGLAIAPQPFFSPRGTPLSVYYRSLVTSEMGIGVDLLTYGEGQDVVIPGVRIVRIPRIRFLEPIKIGPSAAKLFLDVFVILWTLGLLIRNRYDFVHAHEESIFFSRFLKPIFGFKLIYDMHSSLPEQLTNYKFTTSKLVIGAFEWLENTCLKASDAVITICPELARHAEARMPDPSRHLLIENSIFDPVRLKDAPPRPADAPMPELAEVPSDRPIVVYAGTFEAYQGLDILIEGFAQARAACPEAFLLMVGGNPAQVERYRALAHGHGLEGHCLFTGRVEQVRAKACMARADILTSPRSTGSNTPLKIYELLDSGKPIVATRILSHTQVLDEEVCFMVDPTPASMAGGLSAALTDTPRREGVVAAARALYRERYSRPIYEAKMRRLFEIIGLGAGLAPARDPAARTDPAPATPAEPPVRAAMSR
ncbi:glycosyltransferase family 4 protein [uncultured Jannaschia sp.]|uniref:glycosyltransferase family 4 protein n=1 Tax=uncultured Jannaschia sp. TaxID=293347 RepID=UPI0026362E04|nr:glycosyltransferase family 4 protein [uncultured Jannaschia sp.]